VTNSTTLSISGVCVAEWSEGVVKKKKSEKFQNSHRKSANSEYLRTVHESKWVGLLSAGHGIERPNPSAQSLQQHWPSIFEKVRKQITVNHPHPITVPQKPQIRSAPVMVDDAPWQWRGRFRTNMVRTPRIIPPNNQIKPEMRGLFIRLKTAFSPVLKVVTSA
jgi:hypothetical protein